MFLLAERPLHTRRVILQHLFFQIQFDLDFFIFYSFVLISHMRIKISDHKFVEMYLWGCSSSQPQRH